MKRFSTLLFVVIGALGMASPSLRAENVITTRQVKFKPGTSSTTLRGSVQGYDAVHYELGAKAGQTLSVKLNSRNTFLYFNVANKRTNAVLETAPAPREVTEWTGRLPETGVYVVQVYLVRAEARRGRKADFRVSLSITGQSDTDRAVKLAGTRWQLREISYNDGTTYKPKGKEKMTLEFGKDGRVTGNAGINRFTGTYKADSKGALSIGRLTMTRAANPPGSIADTYVKVLRSARLYLFNKGMLVLDLPYDSGEMQFTKLP